MSEFDIELHFTRSAEELEEVLKLRGQSNRLGLAVQIGLLKLFGCYPPQATIIQPEALRLVAQQIGIPSPDIAG